jgi:thiamine-phosphate pyrophosphorylase
MSRPKINGLYAITPELTDTASLVAITKQVITGGARLVQYRSKTTETALRLEQAQSLAHLCRKFGIPLIINDYLDLAIKVRADGVHLGREDSPLSEARRVLGDEKIIGISCYNTLEYAVEAERKGADYVAFGAFFASRTKPGAVPASLNLLRQAKQKLQVPIVAIGGITSDNAVELISEGANAVAVSNALFGARDVRAAAAKFTCLFEQNQHSISHHHGLANDFT